MSEWVECATQAQVDAAIRAGNWPTVRSGYFTASGSATVRAYDSATVEAYDSATVEAYDSATVRAYGSATVEAYDSATVRASGSATVRAYGSATVRASGSATVRAYGSATTVEASKYVAIHRFGTTPTVTGGVLIQVPDLTDLANWLDYYGLKPARGSVVVYKAVGDDLTSGRGMRYGIGEKVAADDWEPGNFCGRGLHFGPTPRHARRYHTEATRYLACRVRLADTSVVGNAASADKVKARACTVLYEVDIDGERIEAVA